MKLKIERSRRPGNAEMSAFLGLITLITGDSGREIEYEQGGSILVLEGDNAELSRLEEALKTGNYPPANTCDDPDFQMGLSSLGGSAKWQLALENFRASCTAIRCATV